MKRLTNNVITGSDERLGLYFYYSHHFGHNIVRKTTSLTGQRVKNDNAFKGFRESINRMKQASPIAASLYRLIPAETKQYSIYRLLTSEALKMIKAGLETNIIIENLHRTYIEPLINEPEKELIEKEKIEPEKGHEVKGLKSFIRYPDQRPHKPGRIRKSRRHLVLQNVVQNTEFQTGSDFLDEQDRNTSARHKIVSLAQQKFKHTSKGTEEKISGLVYLCRLPECKSLKIWIRPSDFPSITG
jgi:hypothetical protein